MSGPRRESAHDAATRGFRTDIQGLRAVAVVLVVAYHAGLQQPAGGFVGVDVFFVISGYLISRHLMSSIAAGSFRFAAFYARRARRLLPAALTVLLATVVIAAVWLPPLAIPHLMAESAATAVYVPNVMFAIDGVDYLSVSTPSPLQHYWSLGVEEQFYLVWPLLLVIGALMLGKSPRRIAVLMAVVTVGSFALGVWATGWQQPLAFFLLPTRAWELGVGGLIAVLLLGFSRLSTWRRGRSVAGWAGLGGIVAAAVLLSDATPFPGWAAAIPVLATAVVILAGATPTAFGPGGVLAVSPLQFLGKISYSLYLVHWPLITLPQAAIGWENPLPLWVTVGLGVVSIPIAWVLWRFVEEPGRTSSWLARTSRRTLLVALAGGVALTLVATGVWYVNSRLPLAVDREASALDLSRDPVGTTFVPSNLSPDLRSASDDNAAVYSGGCHRPRPSLDPTGCQFGDNLDAPLVVMFGDSHAATWFPPLRALADAGVIRLDFNSKASCASASLTDRAYPECTQWRDGVIDRLRQEQPDLVIIANFVEAHLRYTDDWARDLAETIDRIGPTSEFLVLSDVPNFPSDPPTCLSAHLDDTRACWASIDIATDADARRFDEQGAHDAGAGYLDLIDYFCAAECYPIQGDVLAYRDWHHLTETFSLAFTDILHAAIDDRLDRVAPVG